MPGLEKCTDEDRWRRWMARIGRIALLGVTGSLALAAIWYASLALAEAGRPPADQTELAYIGADGPMSFPNPKASGQDPQYSADELNALQAADHRCQSCHVFEAGQSHPVDVRPSMPVPTDMPLLDGRLSCVTCHRADQVDHLGRKANDMMLRASAERGNFCNRCHRNGAYGSVAMHGVMVGRAHLQGGTDAAAFAGNRSFTLDRESQLCLSCHDGSAAVDIGHSHPVGVRYDDSPPSPRSGRMGYVSRERLDTRIRLFEGRVGCGSCHTPYADSEPMLAIPYDRHSTLCLSCHQPG